MMRRWTAPGLAALLLLGCGVGGAGGGDPVTAPRIELAPGTDGWHAEPVHNDLAEVSNNGFGYTGEIHAYRMEVPEAGRLQVSLSWEQSADLDLLVAGDPDGGNRLAEGVLGSNVPEYVGLDVQAGQVLWLLVAGWEGEPGEYVLEAMLLPPDAPVFTMVAGPPLEGPAPRNRPLEFTFNVPLDPDQTPAEHLLMLATGHQAEGTWVIDGATLRFFPRLPVAPADEGGLREDTLYTFQIPRAADGLRAVTGEYLEDLETVEIEVGGLAPPELPGPLRVLGVDAPEGTIWDGSPIRLTLSSALDPSTVAGGLCLVDATDEELPLATVLTLKQPDGVEQPEVATLTVELWGDLPPASHLRLRLPGSLLALGEPDPLLGGLTGRAPAPPCQGFVLDLSTP